MLVLVSSLSLAAQVDPGVRTDMAAAGAPIAGLTPEEEKLFFAGWERFKQLYSVSGSFESGAGLGPAFNATSCAQCHAQPSTGGSSSGPKSPQVHQVVLVNQRMELGAERNPQLALAELHRKPGQSQAIPSFVKPDGPVKVVRFIKKPDGTPDGEVHGIYTIAGREDAPGCSLPQPNFEEEAAKNNLAFRIPTPTFGEGFIEAIPDATLQENLSRTAAERRAHGIGGRFNRSPNDGTITRFGWKAQGKSLLIFAAESYNVEMGVTSEGFPNERDPAAGCALNPLPEDRTRAQIAPDPTYQASPFTSNAVSFATFIRLTGPPVPATHTPSELNGKELFLSVGCALCHSPTLETGKSAYSHMSNVAVHPYSDYALHHMGPALADHITQGLASSDEFRTAPLWGIGQRMFFLHDGRTTDLQTAILSHSSSRSKKSGKTASDARYDSEANYVVASFQALSKEQKQDILNFLRSL